MVMILENATGYEVGARVTVPCGENASEEIGATTNGIVWPPDLRREG